MRSDPNCFPLGKYSSVRLWESRVWVPLLGYDGFGNCSDVGELHQRANVMFLGVTVPRAPWARLPLPDREGGGAPRCQADQGYKNDGHGGERDVSE